MTNFFTSDYIFPRLDFSPILFNLDFFPPIRSVPFTDQANVQIRVNGVNKVSWWALWVEDLEIFETAFLLKTFIWTWIFFKYCRVLSLKTKTKILHKKDATRLKDAWHSKRQKKNIEKTEQRTKMRKSTKQ